MRPLLSPFCPAYTVLSTVTLSFCFQLFILEADMDNWRTKIEMDKNSMLIANNTAVPRLNTHKMDTKYYLIKLIFAECILVGNFWLHFSNLI